MPGQHRAPGGVVGFGRRLRQVVADHGDLAVGDPDVGLDLADAGNDQRAIANNQVERFAVVAFRHDLAFRYDQEFLRERGARDLAAFPEDVAPRRLQAQRLVHGRRADHHQVRRVMPGAMP